MMISKKASRDQEVKVKVTTERSESQGKDRTQAMPTHPSKIGSFTINPVALLRKGKIRTGHRNLAITIKSQRDIIMLRKLATSRVITLVREVAIEEARIVVIREEEEMMAIKEVQTIAIEEIRTEAIKEIRTEAIKEVRTEAIKEILPEVREAAISRATIKKVVMEDKMIRASATSQLALWSVCQLLLPKPKVSKLL
jgi:hypothetical protein